MAFDELHANVVREVGQMKAQLDVLSAENTRLRNRLAEIEAVAPACFPDGTGILAPSSWIMWAKGKLGYTPGVGAVVVGQRELDFEAGWRAATSWAKRYDLLADIGSPAYLRDRSEFLKAAADGVTACGNTPYDEGPFTVSGWEHQCPRRPASAPRTVLPLGEDCDKCGASDGVAVCRNVSDCTALHKCMTAGVCDRAQKPIQRPTGEAKTDSRCDYLAVGLCNKCGREHDGKGLPFGVAGTLKESGNG